MRMFGSVVLDVAIGMVFVFLLMSLIASVVQEMLATFMQLRPANLLRGLVSLFSGDSLWGKDLVDSIYTHGLTRGLFADPHRDLRSSQTNASPTNPPTDATSQLTAAGADNKAPKDQKGYPYTRPLDPLRRFLRNVIGITPEKEVSGVTNQLLLPAYIPSRTFALAMIDILNRDRVAGEGVMQSITDSLKAHQIQFADNKAGEALYTLAVTSKGDLDAFQKHLEHWYNDAMDRVSGWYKRYTQRVLLCIGLLLAVGFNVSSVMVARTLWFDRDARTAMASAADAYVKAHPNAPKDAGVPSSPVTADAQEDKASNESDLQKKLLDSAEAFNTATSTALLPVGWKHPVMNWKIVWADFEHSKAPRWSGEWWDAFDKDLGTGFRILLPLLAGWFITACAISLGAPFWFDMLNKIMVVRSTIKPQEKSQPEGSKDKAPAKATS
jgi:hypothetical protein